MAFQSAMRFQSAMISYPGGYRSKNRTDLSKTSRFATWDLSRRRHDSPLCCRVVVVALLHRGMDAEKSRSNTGALDLDVSS